MADSDGDGRVNCAEFTEVMRHALDEKARREVTWSYVSSCHSLPGEAITAKLRFALKVVKRNGDGDVPFRELSEMEDRLQHPTGLMLTRR